jgi:hypothetical protein
MLRKNYTNLQGFLGPVWFQATFCQAKVWLTIKVWQPQKVWQRNMKPNFGKSWQQQ